MRIFGGLLVTACLMGPVQALEFQNACKAGKQIVIGAVGDFLLHAAMQDKGYKSSGGYKALWPDVIPFMKAPHVMYGNLESPTAKGVALGGKKARDPGRKFDGKVYTGYPKFNAHPTVLKDIKASGVDIVSTANNHSMDRGPLGVERTIDALKDAKLAFTGTRKKKGQAFHTITTGGGFKIAWISCTRDTNGLADPKGQVNRCYGNGVSNTIRALKGSTDAVIVTPHWGVEYSLSTNGKQRSFARRWLDDGATAILGAHPHVPQPWEKYNTKDGREGFIIYSLGNFIAAQSAIEKKTSMLLYLGLSKAGGKTWVNGVRYLPLYMQHFPHKVVPTGYPGQRKKGHDASLAILSKMYGLERMVRSGERINTNFEC